ncbi:DeoR/GlpR family DNA-binding transcription regulator [Polyangium aurulentum]|uniref:DeoR/GlpR family DNA-binding transcription regulator n=1 Tax=Polyangium aurulentum TaxID=2567896 RepID=UPI0010AE0E28|nr:DeoR/GlpR family DNA-binding transcription regulator [Polyangium aurulentum]UQA56856.1 DeoR/GlpR family DNA-binding transcription regulator [Polyangium aurulentum]
MLTEERRRKILETLASDQKVVASALAAQFGVSEDTIRRDLRELAEEGLLRRVYGGAVPRSPTAPTYAGRQIQSVEAKSAIAATAARFLRDGQVVLFDAGTTALAVATSVPRNLSLTVVTHSLPVASALAEHPTVEVIVLGGRLLKESIAMSGAETVEGYRRYRADLCVLGTASVHPDIGLGVYTHEDAEVKRAMVSATAEVMVVAAGEKLGTTAPFLVGPISIVDRLVTDRAAPEEVIQSLTRTGIEIVQG